MADVLAVLVGEDVAGTVRRRTNNLLTFEYDPAYRARPDATPMSLSMPLAAAVHADTPARRTVTNYLAGLLPDDSDVVERWARYYSVRTSSPMFVLGTPVGRDCAGGVAFCPPGELSDFRARGGAVEWLTTGDVADLLRDLQRDRTAMLGRDFTGQFSLAGAQRKTALRREPGTGRWGRPSGTEPTTHILKPAISGWAEQDINEHLCLAAANRSGLTAARSSIECFDDQEAIVVARYDRIARPSGVIRVHQEDLCQGLGLGPDRKYESDGGPTAKGIAALLRRVMPPRDADAAVRTFADGLIWNWLVMGTDAHAKNYSVLLLGRDVRLAPFYEHQLDAALCRYPQPLVARSRPRTPSDVRDEARRQPRRLPAAEPLATCCGRPRLASRCPRRAGGGAGGDRTGRVRSRQRGAGDRIAAQRRR